MQIEQLHPARRAAAIALLALPTVLAFSSGGFFELARLRAAVFAWALLTAVTLFGGNPLPRSNAGRLALGSLALLCIWTAVSLSWAPLKGPAFEDLQRLLLYLAVFATAVAVLSSRPIARFSEPAVALGALTAIGYGISERLLPRVISFEHSRSAGGRLEQPLTYWNAVGFLAALGLVLAARIAGDRTRPRYLRICAAASTAPFGIGVYLSFSRGALVALGVGLCALIVLSPTWQQLRAVTLALVAAGLAALTASLLPSFQTVGFVPDRPIYSLAERERAGAAVAAALVALAVASGIATGLLQRAEQAKTVAVGLLPRSATMKWLLATGAVVVVICFVAVAIGGEGSSKAPQPAFGANAKRLTSFNSNRYDYWKVALRSFADHPFGGVGSAGFYVEWLRQRPFPEPAKDAHSLYLETASELGLVGLILLGGFLVGLFYAGRRAVALDRALAVGPCAALVMWAVHAGIDWDWELPAITLPALLFAALLVCSSERVDAPESDDSGDQVPFELQSNPAVNG